MPFHDIKDNLAYNFKSNFEAYKYFCAAGKTDKDTAWNNHNNTRKNTSMIESKDSVEF